MAIGRYPDGPQAERHRYQCRGREPSDSIGTGVHMAATTATFVVTLAGRINDIAIGAR